MGKHKPNLEKGLTSPPPKLEICEKMVETKIGSLNISAGVPFIPKVLNCHLDPPQVCLLGNHALYEEIILAQLAGHHISAGVHFMP